MNPAPAKPERPAGLTQRAQTLIDLGRPQEAVAVLLQCLSQSPGDYRALCLLAVAHGNAGNLNEAERCAEQAIEAAPDKEWGHRLLAKYLMEQGAPHTALPAAEEAARLLPEEPKALYALASAQRRSGKWREAQKTAERLRAVAPDAYSTHEMLTLVAMRRGNWRQAEARARRALALDANAYSAHNNLGVAVSHQSSEFEWRVSPGRFAEAIECLSQAMTLNPAAGLPRENLQKTLGRCLLVKARFLSWLAALGLLFSAGLELWEWPALWDGYALLLLLAAAVLAFAVRLTSLSRRRFRALPPPVQEFWRQRRRNRRL